MLMQCWAYHSANALSSGNLYLAFSSAKKYPKYNLIRNPKKSSQFTCLVNVGFDDFAEIVHNKVLIAAGVSAAIGQLSKPFTSVILYRKDLDFKTAFQAGGFPSTHSSSVVAAATSLALERGFSDSIFGLTVVYAGLVMYDAQGVRREVGNHAKALNKVLTKAQVNWTISSEDRDDLIDSQGAKSSFGTFLSKESTSFTLKSTSAPLLVRSGTKVRQTNQNVMSSGFASDVEGEAESYSAPLKDSIGHTEFEVVAGALLGLFVSLVVYSLM